MQFKSKINFLNEYQKKSWEGHAPIMANMVKDFKDESSIRAFFQNFIVGPPEVEEIIEIWRDMKSQSQK